MNLSLRSPVSSWLRILFAGVIAVAGTSLAACSGGVIGSGNSPQRLVIAAPGALAPLPTLRMYQCLTSGLRALLYFSDNSVGDFTDRVVWSSSNTGAVQVSNGDIPIPGEVGFYAAGTLIPAGSGSAIITANYFGIIQQTAISVGTPQSIQVQARIQGLYVPLNQVNLNSPSTSTSFVLGAGTTLQLAATLTLDGVETDVSTFATFGFKSPNNSIAIIGGAAVINAIGNANGSLIPMVSFASCPLTNLNDPANPGPGVSFTVSPVHSITVVPEFLPNPGQPLSATNTPPPLATIPNGNATEKFQVIANLDNGVQQDVTALATLTTPNSGTAATFTSGGSGAGNNILTVTDATTQVNVLGALTANGQVFYSDTTPVPVSGRTLITIATCTTPVNVPIPAGQNCPTATSAQPPTLQAGTLTPLQYHAIGYFGLDVDSNGNSVPFYQEVTRQTTWTSSTPAVANISNTAGTAGQALGVQTTGGYTYITGTDSNATGIQQIITQLQVLPIAVGANGN